MSLSEFLFFVAFAFYSYECWRVGVVDKTPVWRHLYVVLLAVSITSSVVFSLLPAAMNIGVLIWVGTAIVIILLLFYFIIMQ